MSDQPRRQPSGGRRKPGWIVTFAGTGINLALGVLYAWSVISKQITKEWGWNETQAALPYSVAIIVFAIMMVPAGRMQDKYGPRLVATLGGILCGIGFIIASLGQSITGMVIGFGILAGAGIGCGYASATPPAVKWFPSARTGLIAGLVVAGFGLASVYIAPLANYLLSGFGIQSTFLVLGIAFLIAVVILSQLLKNPPPGYKPAGNPASGKAGSAPKATAAAADYEWTEMVRTPQFFLLWIMFVFGAGAGLMIIGKLAKIVDLQAGIKAAFIFVAMLASEMPLDGSSPAFFPTRSAAPGPCSRSSFSRRSSFFLRAWTLTALFLASVLIGFNYGANLSVFLGYQRLLRLKNFGVNHGFTTAWGVGNSGAHASG
jgi:OFA family oxalate/formate antiporter-like MFS transporter